MIEIIYNESKKGTTGNDEIFHIPNNIRQIGENKGHHKIYMEDYAYTFLKRMSREDTETGCAAILLGEAKWRDATSYMFIRGALKIEEAEITAEHMPFSDSVWGEINKNIEAFFPDQEIIGWALSLPGFNMNSNEIIQRAHLDHFAGSQKTLFVMEPVEKEEAFYIYDNNQLSRQDGFYIYYEKNEPMQSYMIEKNGNSSIEDSEHVTDRAVLNFRKIVAGKKEEQKNDSSTKRLLYGASACAVIALLAFGITYLNNYNNMKATVAKVSSTTNQEENEPESSEEIRETEVPVLDTEANEAAADHDSTENNSQDNSNISSGENNNAAETTAAEETPESTPTETPAAEQQEPEVQEETVTSMGNQKYVVRKGDTLTQISETYYGTIWKIDDICAANNMSVEDIIYEGQIILLP